MPMTKEEIEQKRAEAMAARTAGGTPAARGSSALPNQSRLTLARAAIRPEMKGRVMLSGPAGAGKTYTSLVIATTLVGPDGRILVIDSEKESSLTYADVFTFEHLRWNPPFDPTALSLTLKEAADTYDCAIVDSFSHFWRKQGGVLDIAGDNVRGWKAARPIQENLIETLLDVDMHVIVCCRSKMDHLIETKDGKTSVTKAGIKAQQDDDLEYEVNVALELDMPHVLHIVKSRTNAVPVGTEYLAGLAGDFAQQYRSWLASGEPVADKSQTDALAAAFDQIADVGRRTAAKQAFLAWFGRPEFLLVSRLGEAQEWVAAAVAGTLPVERGEDDTPPEDEPPDDGSPKASPAAAGIPAADGAETGVEDGRSDPVASSEAPDPESIQHVADRDGPEHFNGDAGHCSDCGSPIWFSIESEMVKGRNIGAWLHADADDSDLCPGEGPIVPAGDGIDVDALYAATHAHADPALVEARVRAEVMALSQSKLLKAILAAKLPSSGQPSALRERLIEHRLQAASQAVV